MPTGNESKKPDVAASYWDTESLSASIPAVNTDFSKFKAMHMDKSNAILHFFLFITAYTLGSISVSTASLRMFMTSSIDINYDNNL